MEQGNFPAVLSVGASTRTSGCRTDPVVVRRLVYGLKMLTTICQCGFQSDLDRKSVV